MNWNNRNRQIYLADFNPNCENLPNKFGGYRNWPHPVTSRHWMNLSGVLFFILLFTNCQPTPPTIPLTEQEIATKWADLTLYITQHTPANSPTFASRCLGYIGLTMYETVVHGSKEYQSLGGQLNRLASLPKPNKNTNWQLALNAGQAEILRSIYIQTSDSNKAKIDSLENLLFNSIAIKVKDQEIKSHSVQYGKEVAQQIFEWSKTDGGHRGYLNNFDKTFDHPIHEGAWKPPLYAQSFSHHPLHPYWGNNRTFVTKNGELPNPDYVTYDTTKTSAYYQEFVQVYQKEQSLTQVEKEAAIWWSDDPDSTFTPPGHSYYIATIAINAKQPPLIECAATYAHVGMAVADAFVLCWRWKYHFFTERPNTFIPTYMDQEWESFWPDPPFPSFPSGHAIQAAASSTVLADLYGNNFQFTDNAHANRHRDELRDTDFKPRSYNSFWEVAEETADSRLYGGIHTPLDNQVGLEEGRKIGRNVAQLQWTK